MTQKYNLILEIVSDPDFLQEFQEFNGIWSLPDEQDVQLAKSLVSMGLREREEDSASTGKEGSAQPEKKSNGEEVEKVSVLIFSWNSDFRTRPPNQWT